MADGMHAAWAPPPTELRREGACASPGVDADMFFPVRGAKGQQQVAGARAVCADCPVRQMCRDWALSQPADRLIGVWGGTTVSERYGLIRAARRASA